MDRAGDLLKEFLKRQGLSGDEPVVSLFQGWAQLVEPPLLDHSRIIDLKNGILWVEVDHPGWMQILHLQQSRILQRIRRRYPPLAVRGLSCRVNLRFSRTEPERKQDSKGPDRAAEERGAAEAAQAVSGVQEPELKELLLRLFKRVSRSDRGAGFTQGEGSTCGGGES